MITQTTSQSLALYRSGDPANPAVLFLHGAGLSGRMWQPQMERLSEFYCLAPDLPGQGQSREVPLELKDTLERIARLLKEQTTSGSAHIVGLSFGGVVAQGLMSAAPNQVDHAILSGTSGRMRGWLLGALKLSLALNKPIIKLLSPSQLAWLTAVQFGIPRQFRQMLGEDMKQYTPQAFAATALAYGQVETPAHFPRPVLVCVGQRETLPARRMAHRLVLEIPAAVGVTVPEAGHVWNLQKPDLFTETVRGWVSGEGIPPALIGL